MLISRMQANHLCKEARLHMYLALELPCPGSVFAVLQRLEPPACAATSSLQRKH